MTRGDVIQISLGPSANAVTAHLLNVQGLAATTSRPHDSNCHDATTTHCVNSSSAQHPTWVPRALLIDEATRVLGPRISSSTTNASSSLSSFFKVQPLDASWAWSHVTEQTSNPNHNVLSTAWTLAQSKHSRYSYQDNDDNETHSYRASTLNPRHVVWDEEEEEEEEEETEQDRQQRLVREKNQWQQQVQEPLQAQMAATMESWYADTSTSLNKESDGEPTNVGAETTSAAAPATTTPPHNGQPPTHWTEFFMPPYSPSSMIALPYSHQSQMTSHWNHYTMATSSSDNKEIQEWKEDVLYEQLRHLLEASDTLQGVTITTQGHGLYAGLATCLLQELQQECPSAIRVLFSISNPPPEEESSSQDNDDPGWQPAQVARVRHHMASGLALYEACEYAHAYLPLQWPSPKNHHHDQSSSSLFASSAILAMALEAITLPWRLKKYNNNHNHKDYQMGLQNAPFMASGGQDVSWGSTAASVRMAEWLHCVQPSHRYPVLECDVLAQPNKNNNINNETLWQALQQGTSISRDARLRQRGGEGRVVEPGLWLQDQGITRNDNNGRGLLTSLSPRPATTPLSSMDRTLHHHFAMATTVRSIIVPLSNHYGNQQQHPDHSQAASLSNYLTCLVQGMGIRYRPERSLGLVRNQTLGQLTSNSGDAAAAYWKGLLSPSTPSLAVVSNSTRSYAHLNQIAQDMKQVLQRGPFQGFYTRDVMNGILPEVEDCQEALEQCWDLRDVYMPPPSSGLLDDDDDIDY